VKDDRDFQRRFLPALQPPVSSAVKPREPRKFPVLLSQTPCLLRKSPGPDITVTPDPLLHVFGNFDSDVTVRNFFKCPGLFFADRIHRSSPMRGPLRQTCCSGSMPSIWRTPSSPRAAARRRRDGPPWGRGFTRNPLRAKNPLRGCRNPPLTKHLRDCNQAMSGVGILF